jgi:hypothetical protein
VAIFTAAGMGSALLVITALNFSIGLQLSPVPRSNALDSFVEESRFALPLALGVVATLTLLIPIHKNSARGRAELARRTTFSYIHKSWLGGVATITGTIVTVTTLAGMASTPDEQGAWRLFKVDAGTEGSFGTTIYGWHYSLPAMTLTCLLLAIAVIGLWLIAQPALGANSAEDARSRRLRSRNICAAVSGALLIHLGRVFISLASTASLHGRLAVGEGGWAIFNTSFSALQPALSIAGSLSTAVGYAFWVTVLLSAVIPLQAERALVGPR